VKTHPSRLISRWGGKQGRIFQPTCRWWWERWSDHV